MKYMLDTNICIYLIKKKPEHLIKKITSLDPLQMGISAVTWSELVYGVEKSLFSEKNRKALYDFIYPFEILSWNQKEADRAGVIRAQLEKSGNQIGPYDLQIAAHADTLGLTLVTNNENEFRRIKSLHVENWAK